MTQSVWVIEFGPNHGRVVRDGVDISNEISGLTLELRAAAPPQIALHLGGRHLGIVDGSTGEDDALWAAQNEPER